MFKKLSIVNKISLVITFSMLVCFGAIGLIVSKLAYDYFYEQSIMGIKKELHLLSDEFEAFNISSKEAADKMASVFVNMAGVVTIDSAKDIKVGDFMVHEIKADG
ncbi:MAG: hypothetical protein RL154_565, partial [Pseudomonadota bacterium]